MRKSCLTAVTIVSCYWFVSACSEQTEVTPTASAAKPLNVQTYQIKPQRWQLGFDSYGYLESTEKIAVGVDFSGTVDKVFFEQGAAIKAGQSLIELDASKQKLRLKRAEATVESANAELEKADSTYQRHRNLVANGALSKEEFKKSKADFERASANVQDARAALSIAQQELRETTVISPVDGTVVESNLERGQVVLPGDTLAVVQVNDTLRMVTYISQKEVNLLKVGDKASVVSPAVPGREYEARVELIGSDADPNTGNYVVKLTINNQDRVLRSGMSARAKLQGIVMENTLLIPKQAIVDRNRRKVVFTVNDGIAKAVQPVFGVAGAGELIPVFAGLNEGDVIALSQLDLLVDQSAVTTPSVDDRASSNSDGESK